MKSILDPTFNYTPSVNTDLRKTFARIRREQRRQSQATPETAAEPPRLKLASIGKPPKQAAVS